VIEGAGVVPDPPGPKRWARRAHAAPSRGGERVIGTPNDSGQGIVAVAGEALVDLVPAPVSEYFEARPGGSPANVAVGLARLGVPTRMLARIADDMLGRRLTAHLEDNDVDLSHVVLAAEQTSMAMVSVGADGGPSYDFRITGTADWQWTPDELKGALDGPVVALHSGSLALTMEPGAPVLRELMSTAAATATISYDPNCRPLLMGDPAAVLAGVHELLGVADVVKVSSEDLAWLSPGTTPEDVLQDWIGRGPAIVAITLGSEGVLAGTSDGLRVRRPGVLVTVIDTVGAGDTFSGALLAGLHERGLLGAEARTALRAIDASTLEALLDQADPPTREDLAARARVVGGG
jgi:fructokinase